MKKLILVLLIIGASFQIAYSETKCVSDDYADSIQKTAVKTAKSIIPDTMQLTFKQVYGDVKEALKGLAENLKVGTEHVYAVLVKQQVVYAVVYLLVFALGVLSLCMFFGTCSAISKDFKEWKKTKSTYEDYWTFKFIFASIWGLVFFISTGIGLAHIEVIITGFINPEYGAIKEILNLIKAK